MITRNGLVTASTTFGFLAAVGPLTVVLYPWAFVYGALALCTGLIAGRERAKVGILLGIVCPLLSLAEILVARALR